MQVTIKNKDGGSIQLDINIDEIVTILKLQPSIINVILEHALRQMQYDEDQKPENYNGVIRQIEEIIKKEKDMISKIAYEKLLDTLKEKQRTSYDAFL